MDGWAAARTVICHHSCYMMAMVNSMHTIFIFRMIVPVAGKLSRKACTSRNAGHADGMKCTASATGFQMPMHVDRCIFLIWTVDTFVEKSSTLTGIWHGICNGRSGSILCSGGCGPQHHRPCSRKVMMKG